MERLLAVLLLSFCAPLTAQTTHYADIGGGCDGLAPCHPTIMAAVAAAADGDTVSVFPGRYPERVEIVGRLGLRLVGRTTDPLVCTATPRRRAALVQELFVDEYAGVRVENLVLLGGALALRSVAGAESVSVFTGNQVHGRWFVQNCFDVTLRGNAFEADATLEVQADNRCAIEDNGFDAGGILFGSEDNSTDSAIVGNVLRSGDIRIESERVRGVRIAGNRLFAGDLVIDAREPDDNLIEDNVLDAGGLRVAGSAGNRNVIRRNRVFDSAGNGIELALQALSRNTITGNTSRGHALCDVIDVETAGVDNEWSGNDFDTACGGADG